MQRSLDDSSAVMNRCGGPRCCFVTRVAAYERELSTLAEIKRKYDPDGLFFVHSRVGSEQWSADRLTGLAAKLG